MWNIPASYQLKLHWEMQFKKKVHLWSFLAPLLKVTPCVRSPFGGDEHRSAPHPETFQNFPRKKRGVEEHHHFICSHRFSKIPPSYFQKKEWFPELWQPDPSFPHCIVVINMRSAGGDLPCHAWVEKLLVPLEGEDAQKQDSVWWHFLRKRSNLHMLMCEWKAEAGCE